MKSSSYRGLDRYLRRRDPTRDSTFFAAMPEPFLARRFENYADEQKRSLVLAGELRPWPRLHVTLSGLGLYARLTPALIEAAKRAVASIDRHCFKAEFDRLESFGRQSGRSAPLVLCGSEGVYGFFSLHVAIQEALGRKPDPHYRPHMTLLWGPNEVPERPLDLSLTWWVREIVLIHSLYGLSDYRILGRWPLREPSTGPRRAFEPRQACSLTGLPHRQR